MIEDGPKVKLIDATHNAFDLSIASARTCYSGKGIIEPGDVSKTEKDRELRDRIAKETKKAGHLTTRQHVQFIFAIWDISRQSVWSYLHSHPYYNSGQVSQRYVEVKPGSLIMPPLSPKGKDIYRDIVTRQMASYKELIGILELEVARYYFEIFPNREKNPAKWKGVIKKKAMEIARYVLPIGTGTYLYYTINGLTLHRFQRLKNFWEPEFERRILVEKMVQEVKRTDPLFFEEMDDPIALDQTPEYQLLAGFGNKSKNKLDAAWKKDFDKQLGQSSSRLVSFSQDAESLIAQTASVVMGMNDLGQENSQDLSFILDPAKFPYLGSTLNPAMLSPLGRVLDQVHFTFQKRLSHTADSQDQRHRTVPAARPILWAVYDGTEDYITPKIVSKSEKAYAIYNSIMQETFIQVNRLLDMGEKKDEAILALPNAYPVRFYETGSLLNLHHKWKLRLCYLAQEEIFASSIDELKEVKARFPNIAKWIKAPCWLRKQASDTPYCPEGERFCGVQVWKKEIEEYDRVI